MIPSSSRSSAGLSDSRSRCTSSSNEEAKDISALVTSAKEYLAVVVTDLSQPSTAVTLERRKSYWRILRASRHLSIFESSIVALDLKPTETSLSVIKTEVHSTGALSVIENLTMRTELHSVGLHLSIAESKNSMAESLSTLPIAEKGISVIDSTLVGMQSPPGMNLEIKTELQSIAPNASVASVTAATKLEINLPDTATIENGVINRLADPATIPSNTSMTALLPKSASDAEAGVITAKVSLQSDTLMKKASEDPSVHTAPEPLKSVIETQSDESIQPKIEDEKEVNQRKISHEILEDFSSRMGNISMETNMQQWLEISRSYWTALRVSKRGPVDPVEVEVVEAPLTYFSTNQSKENSSNMRESLSAPTSSSSNAIEEVDLSSDRMHMSGFAGIAKKLPSIHPADVTLTLWGLDKFELWPSQVVTTNPSYTYEDNPLPGWSKNICVRMGGKLQGSLEITYCPPERTRRLRSKIEILAYLTRYNLSTYLTSRFDFRSVFCVCHTPEDSGSYLECSFGRAGCNRWLHSHCVGLGKRKEGELRDMATVICPLCTVYLESIGAHDYMKNKT